MIRAWLAAAAIVGFFSVAAGAVSAHLGAHDVMSELLRTGALYGMVHAAALLLLIVAGWSFAVGILLFSLSLFALAATGIDRLRIVTPFGGVALLIGLGGSWGVRIAQPLRSNTRWFLVIIRTSASTLDCARLRGFTYGYSSLHSFGLP